MIGKSVVSREAVSLIMLVIKEQVTRVTRRSVENKHREKWLVECIRQTSRT